MGMFDDILGDIKAISKELAETKKAVKSTVSELAGEMTGAKNDINNVAKTLKGQANGTIDDVKRSTRLDVDNTKLVEKKDK